MDDMSTGTGTGLGQWFELRLDYSGFLFMFIYIYLYIPTPSPPPLHSSSTALRHHHLPVYTEGVWILGWLYRCLCLHGWLEGEDMLIYAPLFFLILSGSLLFSTILSDSIPC